MIIRTSNITITPGLPSPFIFPYTRTHFTRIDFTYLLSFFSFFASVAYLP